MVGEPQRLEHPGGPGGLSGVGRGARGPGPRQALSGFKGVKQRQEVAGEFTGVLVLDDFAHHPTAVAVTLAAVRQGLPQAPPGGGVRAPHQHLPAPFSRQPYAQAFNDADLILVREPPDLWKVAPEDDSFSSAQLVADLTARGKQAFAFPDTDQLLAGLLTLLHPGDVVLVMCNGDFDHLIPRLCQALSEG